MTRIAALQLARHNINVNAICPGTTVTALSEANLRDRAREEGVTVDEMRVAAERCAMRPRRVYWVSNST